MIPLLPKWVVASSRPSFYDSETATAIEMVAKLYGSMNELIDDYNKFVDATNNTITNFVNSVEKDYEVFRTELRQEFQDFIDTVELKIKSQDKAIADKFKEQDERIDNEFAKQNEIIADAVNFMKNNIQATLERIVSEMKENGELTEIVEPIVVETVHEVIKPNGVHTDYDLLWENSDPTVEFPAQNIELGAEIMEQYDEFLLTYKYGLENAVDQQWQILRFRPNVQGDFVTGTSGAYVTDLLDFAKIDGDVVPFKRQVATNADKTMFVILDCRAGYDVIEYQNGYLIPCKIYGIKRFAYTDDIKNALTEIDSLIGG